jgi:hypothetical protein
VIPEFFRQRLARFALSTMNSRLPDQVIGHEVEGVYSAYLQRWKIIKSRWGNIYLHRFLRSDDDRALHDHPWSNMSILLCGELVEHRIAAGGVNLRNWLVPGNVVIRLSGRTAHRLELVAEDQGATALTLFFTGPKYREWGFHCPDRGWIHWTKFTDPSGNIDLGCEQ